MTTTIEQLASAAVDAVQRHGRDAETYLMATYKAEHGVNVLIAVCEGVRATIGLYEGRKK